MNERKNIIITGATGFIGSFLTEIGVEKGWQVTAWVRETSNTEHLPSGVNLIKAGFSNRQKMMEALQMIERQNGSIDYIVHNAGVTKTTHPEDFDRVNAENTGRFIEAIQESGISIAKFILMSSLAALGPGNPQTLEPLHPDDVPKPDTLYGKSKLKAEKIVRQSSLPWNIMRPTGVYGPRETDYYLMLRTIKKGLAPVTGCKPHFLSFVYVKDLVKAVFLALETPITQQTFHVSDGKTYTDREYRDLCCKILNTNALKVTVPHWVLKAVSFISETFARPFKITPTLNKDKYLTMRAINWKSDISNTIEMLHYSPEYDLQRGLDESIQWYRKEGWL
ncbi:MAG TPA: NAD(P)-dependent oxidoreductase [Bacteroidales bacterium]|nr:NAD(P)-dependent oxidoreductase [Bacteroidales bacterium]MDI9573648.1 NAD(P)-dependent oxidoreductase [Bacteroidota bacterium]OQC62016.1 MAG: short chain dehydrogenase [Bacteroidetes bacterium ADurb.Bin012]MBP9511022.1 NAD(P)-dependent oxidoreductase [Bacteroidales bacterium]MBP9587722.1 NAD(P)-dependent oxidoreductase [Bacteroidales bacterium]